MQRFVNYSRDFVTFAKSGDDYEVAMDLHTTASETGDYLSAVDTLLEIYSDLSCEDDRSRIQPQIIKDVDLYVSLVENLIERANLDIAHTKMPGIAAEGTRMRDELREVKSTF